MGIDLLRILSMLMVVSLHCIGHGGLTENLRAFSANDYTTDLFHAFCSVAVNVYAIITVFVCVISAHRWSRLSSLWLQAAFYSVALTLLVCLFRGRINVYRLVLSFFPVISKQYWYFTAYFCLFLFIPFINGLILRLSKRRLRIFILTGVAAFSVLAVAGVFINRDVFDINRGYSPSWLLVMYAVGAYIKRFPEDFERLSLKRYLMIYAISSLAAWLIRQLITLITLETSGEIQYDDVMADYISPLMTLGAASLVIAFSRLRIKHFARSIVYVSSFSFSVYLISDHPYVRTTFMSDSLESLSRQPWYATLLCLALLPPAIYIVCIAIDFLRRKLFELLRVERFSVWIVGVIRRSALKLTGVEGRQAASAEETKATLEERIDV